MGQSKEDQVTLPSPVPSAAQDTPAKVAALADTTGTVANGAKIDNTSIAPTASPTAKKRTKSAASPIARTRAQSATSSASKTTPSQSDSETLMVKIPLVRTTSLLTRFLN